MTSPDSQLIQTIRGRRTIQEFNGVPIARNTLLGLLDNAVWAPFHSKKEPWRFILFAGAGRKKFAGAVLQSRPEAFIQQYGAQIYDTYCRRIPAHLLVIMNSALPQKAWEEALAATAALIQNIQLLAWEQGIGVVWKTTAFNEDHSFRAAAGVTPAEKIVGTLHMGYFDSQDKPAPKPRTAAADLLTVIEDD
ncbi:nitroreductase [Paenibacillus sp. LMG 31459]|uniref:Putative NAD(P)H nitroreductase n=1 Tax=Paenibacillus phytohabitans TaxID=2654978 RepID=A0ABX1YCW9_9BACL|nr:nitroreductase family protein [Paenibacillus phytohabitans]NOU78838.1 nitroreductase [Paenibacillus phytohabitans]